MSKFLSDVIDLKRDILPYRVVELISGVGSGKNYWVNKVLAEPKKAGAKYSILFITSRRIVVDSTIASLKKDAKEEKAKGVKSSEKATAQTWVDIDDLYAAETGLSWKGKTQRLVYCTNAKMAFYLQNNFSETNSILKLFDFIVIDEAHSITTDATFTDASFYIHDLIEYVIAKKEELSKLHLILMTGTKEPNNWLFTKKFKESSDYNCLDFFKVCRHVEPQAVLLINEKDANRILKEHVSKGEKVVYFVHTLKRLCDLHEFLIKKCGLLDDDIAISFSASDENDAIVKSAIPSGLTNRDETNKYLAENEALEDNVRVLLSTSKNKEGINIKNDDIHIMFAEDTYKENLKQMVGRVRNDKNDRQITHFYIIYNKFYPLTDTRLDKCMSEPVLQSLTAGDVVLAQEMKKKPFIKDGEKQPFAPIKEYRSRIEKAFPLIRYSRLFERFKLYKGCIEGNSQANYDIDRLGEIFESWNRDDILPEGIVVKSDKDLVFFSGEFIFKAEWFPYSDVVKRSCTKNEARAMARMLIRNWIETHGYTVKPLDETGKKELIDFVNKIIDYFGKSTLGLSPLNEKLTKKFKEFIGATVVKDHHSTSVKVTLH